MPKYTSEGFVTKIKLILLILTGTIADKNVILPMKERKRERESERESEREWTHRARISVHKNNLE